MMDPSDLLRAIPWSNLLFGVMLDTHMFPLHHTIIFLIACAALQCDQSCITTDPYPSCWFPYVASNVTQCEFVNRLSLMWAGCLVLWLRRQLCAWLPPHLLFLMLQKCSARWRTKRQ
jgi:hypothetical protein